MKDGAMSIAAPLDVSNWKDAVTAIATALAVTLAAWKWYFQELIRRKQEIPSIDGDIELEIVESPGNNVGLFLNTIWNNRGTVPIFLNTLETVFEIYEIDTSTAPIAIDQAARAAKNRHPHILDTVGSNENAARMILQFHPIKDARWFMLEPKTKSHIQATVILKADCVYEVRCLIVGEKADQNWFRKRLFSTSSESKHEK
jgi:hypothetical protein